MQISRPAFERLTEVRLDVFAAVVGLALSVALLPLGLFTTAILVHGVPISVGLGCLLYLLSTRASSDEWNPSEVAVVRRLRSPTVTSWVVPRLVVIGLSGMVAVAVLSGGRPLAFLLLAGVVGSLILAQILFAEPTLDHRLVLAEILGFAFVVRYAALLTTPGLVGIDSWTHVTSYAAAIQESGSLAAISNVKYYASPLYHLVTVATAEVLGVSLRSALYLSVAVMMVLSVLFVFSTARYVVGVQGALLATMLFAVADYVIRWGLYVSTTSLGLVFFLAVLFVLTRILYVEVGRIDFVLLGGFAIAVSLTHQVSAFIAMVLLGTAVTVVFFSRYVEEISLPNDDRYLFGTSGAFFAFTGVQWAITPWTGGTFLTGAFDLARGWLSYTGFLNLVADEQVRGDEPTGFVVQLAAYVDTMGLFLFLVVASLGCLTLLQRTRSVGTYTFVGVISVMMVCTLGLSLFGFRFLLPGRWFAFAYAPMAVVAAVGVVHFMNHFWNRGATVVLLVFLLAFPSSMVLAQDATIDQPTFDQQWPQYAHTGPEVAAAETFRETVPETAEPIRTDHPYFMTVKRYGGEPTEEFGPDEASAYMFSVTEDNQVVTHQDPVVYRAYQSEGSPTYLGPNAVPTTYQLESEQVCPETRNHVYAAEDVRMCTGS